MIKINLPNPNDYNDNVGGADVIGFLKQMELSIHHTRKAYEEAKEKLPDCCISFRFPQMNLYGRKQNENGDVLVHVDEESEQMQEIQIEISN